MPNDTTRTPIRFNPVGRQVRTFYDDRHLVSSQGRTPRFPVSVPVNEAKPASTIDKTRDVMDLVDEFRSAFRLLGKLQDHDTATKLTEGYRLACALRETPDLWLSFCAGDWPNKRSKPNFRRPEEALRYLFTSAAGTERRPRQKASNIVRALSPLFARRAPPEEVAELLRGPGGFEGLLETARALDNKPRKPPSHMMMRIEGPDLDELRSLLKTKKRVSLTVELGGTARTGATSVTLTKVKRANKGST